MSKLVFSPHDFNGFILQIDIALRAQAIHDKWLASGTVVTSIRKTGDLASWHHAVYRCETDTHTARLVDVQEIVKVEPECEHEHENVTKYTMTDTLSVMHGRTCNDCGEKLKPTSWETGE